MNDLLFKTWEWIKEDWRSHPMRFTLEVIAWAMSIGCSIAMAATVPTPPLLYIYPFFITGCVIYSWAAWTRRSFGMLANYLLLTTIDSIALIRMLS